MHVQRNGKSRILPGNDGALEALNFIEPQFVKLLKIQNSALNYSGRTQLSFATQVIFEK